MIITMLTIAFSYINCYLHHYEQRQLYYIRIKYSIKHSLACRMQYDIKKTAIVLIVR